jgi:hypothetical protein
MEESKEDVRTIQVSADAQGRVAELVGRKKRLGKKASIKEEVEKAINHHVKKEWKKLEPKDGN